MPSRVEDNAAVQTDAQRRMVLRVDDRAERVEYRGLLSGHCPGLCVFIEDVGFGVCFVANSAAVVTRAQIEITAAAFLYAGYG